MKHATDNIKKNIFIHTDINGHVTVKATAQRCRVPFV